MARDSKGDRKSSPRNKDKMVKAKFDLLQKLANLEPCNTD